MKWGEIRWYEFQPPNKRRPVLILTRNSAIRYLSEITVAPVTSTIRDIPTEILLGTEDGMAQECAINFDHLQTVPKQKIGRLIAALSADKINLIAPALLFALGLDDYIK